MYSTILQFMYINYLNNKEFYFIGQLNIEVTQSGNRYQ